MADYDFWEERASNISYNLLGALAAVPLKSGDQVVGTLTMAFGAQSERRFGDAEIELLNRLKLSISLEQQGHTVALAEDGQQTLDMLNSQPFDMILLDIMMPGLDGY
ncbi:MAG TPA: response regulator [Chloroflexia bacterium]|nr:response regulator [Chloroflexia bacterium]